MLLKILFIINFRINITIGIIIVNYIPLPH